MSNILNAIKTLVNDSNFDIKDHYKSKNRANQTGDALEFYIKDLFADCINDSESKSQIKRANVFSYLGADNKSPDGMLRNGDALEIKKVDSKSGKIQLNSSFPKDHLSNTDKRVSQACKEAESWKKRDLIYIIGQTSKKKLIQLWLVYGDCFAAQKSYYENIADTISSAVDNIPGIINKSDTNELGGISKIDPLNITYLRVRGMWVVKHPNKIFSCLNPYVDDCKFQLSAIMSTEKYKSFPKKDRNNLENLRSSSFKINDVQIQNPNNAANMIDAKFIKYTIK